MSDAFKTLSFSDFTRFYKTPCARDSLLVGMGAGFGIGGMRGIIGGELLCIGINAVIYFAKWDMYYRNASPLASL